jgi:hypothetical protein
VAAKNRGPLLLTYSPTFVVEEFCEVSLVRSSRKFGSEGGRYSLSQKVSANNKYFEKRSYTPSKFIADSSPIGNDDDMHAHPCALRERQTPSRGGCPQSLRASYVWEVAGLCPTQREGERMGSNTTDIFYATPQQRYQASLLLLDAAGVFGGSVRHELNLPGR